jgi:hypothetical protein
MESDWEELQWKIFSAGLLELDHGLPHYIDGKLALKYVLALYKRWRELEPTDRCPLCGFSPTEAK